MRCEDYPCCGHTDNDPCGPQWYDAPDAFDPSINPHCFCDHQAGACEVEYYAEDEDEEEEDEGFDANDTTEGEGSFYPDDAIYLNATDSWPVESRPYRFANGRDGFDG